MADFLRINRTLLAVILTAATVNVFLLLIGVDSARAMAFAALAAAGGCASALDDLRLKE